MTEPLLLELEATPLPPAIRALCVGGPWDGVVMMAPVPRTSMFGSMMLVVKIDGRSAHFRTHAEAQPWIGGCYQLTNAPAHQRQAQMQVRAILGEPHNAGVYWRWFPGAASDLYDVCILTERMVKTHVFLVEEAEDPYEPSGALRELAGDLDLEIHEHPDGDVSFRVNYSSRNPADDLARQILEDLDRQILEDLDRQILGHPYKRRD